MVIGWKRKTCTREVGIDGRKLRKGHTNFKDVIWKKAANNKGAYDDAALVTGTLK